MRGRETGVVDPATWDLFGRPEDERCLACGRRRGRMRLGNQLDVLIEAVQAIRRSICSGELYAGESQPNGPVGVIAHHVAGDLVVVPAA